MATATWPWPEKEVGNLGSNETHYKITNANKISKKDELERNNSSEFEKLMICTYGGRW